ncbi:MAG: response regulator [Armatimonadota bacterium]
MILIVEDDEHISQMVARLLSSKGYRTHIESNGAAALLAAHEHLPELIIMDMMMPILKGLSTIQALREDLHTAHIPIVVLSARDDDRSLAEALTAGANIYLCKPVNAQELLAVVNRLVTLRAAEEPVDVPDDD